MPNYCDFTLRVFGKPENVKTFLSYVTADYCYADPKMPVFHYQQDGSKVPEKHHIGYRVFGAYYDFDFADRNINKEEICIQVSGDCAWSVAVCMLPGPFSYIDDNKDGSSQSLSLLEACKRLDLSCEVFSVEPGMGFSEHYFVDKGKLVTDECVEYNEIYGLDEFETWEDYKESDYYCQLLSKEDYEYAKENDLDDFGLSAFTPHPGDEFPWMLNPEVVG